MRFASLLALTLLSLANATAQASPHSCAAQPQTQSVHAPPLTPAMFPSIVIEGPVALSTVETRPDADDADVTIVTIAMELDGAAPLIANLPPDAILSTSVRVERARSTPTHGRYRVSAGTAATLSIRLPHYKRLLVDVAGKRHAHTPSN